MIIINKTLIVGQFFYYLPFLFSTTKSNPMILLQAPFSLFEGVPLLLLFVMLVVWCIALVAIANGRFHDSTTKLCWFFIVLFLNIIGVLLFVFWGRKEIKYTNSNQKNVL